jgi:hypothetical protein
MSAKACVNQVVEEGRRREEKWIKSRFIQDLNESLGMKERIQSANTYDWSHPEIQAAVARIMIVIMNTLAHLQLVFGLIFEAGLRFVSYSFPLDRCVDVINLEC